MYIGLHVKYPQLLSEFNETWIFLTDFQIILKCKISWKSFECWVELFDADGRMDGQMDVMKLTAALRNFANKPNNQMSQDIYVAE